MLCLGLTGTIACTSRPSAPAGAVNESTSTGECALVWRAPESEPDAGIAPFSLTAQDGSGLELLAVKGRAFVEDPLALTELHLTFRNPNDRVIEGRFEINLPPNSAISRFAMMIDGRWQEAEVVELQAARAAYEDALHRKVDPALLEKAAGNRFSARVFPIPARGVKEIVVSYSEELTTSGAPYRLYLRGLPVLQDLDVEVVVPKIGGGVEKTAVKKQNVMPQNDLELTMPRRAMEAGLRFDRLAVARVAPDVKLPAQQLTGVTLLFDTSASRALDFRGQVARLVKLVTELKAANGGDFPLTVAAFDQTVEIVFAGQASSFSEDAVQAILARGPLGASDLAGALKWVAQSKVHPRVIVVSDGVATAGEAEAGELRKAASGLARAGVQRIDAVVDGGLRDEALLRSLTTSGLANAGILVDARLPLPLVASRLTRATLADVKVSVPGATWVWPQKLDAVQPGDQFLVFADLPADKPMRVELGDKGEDVREVPLGTSSRPLLERAWIRASIERLMAALGEEANASPEAKAGIKQQIIEMSTKYRVLSDFTALLVLETEWDYQRFGIARTAMADILTVGPEGIAVVDRSRPADKNTMPTIDRPIEPPASETRREAPTDDAVDGDSRAEAKRAEAPTRNKQAGRAADSGSMAGPRMDAPAEPMPVEEATGIGGGGAPGTPAAAPPPTSGDVPEPVRVEAPMPEVATDAKSMPKPSPAKRKGASQVEPMDLLNEDEEANVARRPPPVAPPRPITTMPPVQDPFGGYRPAPTFEQPKPADAWEGKFAEVMAEVRGGRTVEAMSKAQAWRDASPGDELALLALGEAAEAKGDMVLAARAYGSLIDLFPGRTDIRRMAGERLEALGEPGLALAIDTYKQAVAQRPDHPASHRLYAFALLKAGRHAEAFAAALAGSRQSYPWGRFAGVSQILQEDLRLIAAAWQAARPDDKEMLAALAAAGVTADTQPTLRFVLNWETDANDVDFHIYDGKGGHAYYSSKALPTGGWLYADVTTGYGPECFTIPGPASAYPYVLQAHYYSRGPMGYGMGKLQAIEHDGKGHFAFKEHPFVIMKDRAYVDLGRVDGPLSAGGPARLPSGPGPAGTGSYTPPPPPPPGTYTPPPQPQPQPQPQPRPQPRPDRPPPPT
ncbi:MAG: hypothetical protein JNL82_23565 [Myxococcales bacterium]|nr:hypothetical protein [Myxococcales bacterium]